MSKLNLTQEPLGIFSYPYCSARQIPTKNTCRCHFFLVTIPFGLYFMLISIQYLYISMLINFHPKLGRHQFYKKTWWSIFRVISRRLSRRVSTGLSFAPCLRMNLTGLKKGPTHLNGKGHESTRTLISILLLKGRILVVFHYFNHSFLVKTPEI